MQASPVISKPQAERDVTLDSRPRPYRACRADRREYVPLASEAATRSAILRARECRPLQVSVPLHRFSFMTDNRLSVRDRELFLAEPHVAALSVSAGPARGPL